MSEQPFDPTPVLNGLKDFQRRTVDRVFERLYLDEPKARRFLVADEVGLGKTMVARGVIARALEHLHDRVDRIDVIYVCSNAAIAAQNVNRLNVLGEQDFSIATRLTMLPVRVHDLASRRINFVSFTPGTSFDLKSRGGLMDERAVLCNLLEGEGWLHSRGLGRLLRNKVNAERWRRRVAELGAQLDHDVRQRLARSVRDDAALRAELVRLADFFSDGRRHLTREVQQDRLALIGRLRQRLASTCIHALEPDLIILDEFQRFRDMLHGESEAAALARALFDYPGARVLLLSATPYKMLSLDHEEEDDHYEDFLGTLRFLFDDQARVEGVKASIGHYRRALYAMDTAEGPARVKAARDELQQALCSVLCRTERVGMTRALDAMLVEPQRRSLPAPGDLHQARALDAVARAAGAPDTLEYWKSAPYVLSFLRGYKVRDQLDALAQAPPQAALKAIAEARPAMLDREVLDNYGEMDPGNARLRALFADTLDRGLWEVLWLPPSMPYSAPAGAYARVGDVTKSLLFSSWSMVPDAVATLCSYEAERRMVSANDSVDRRERLYEQIRPLLRFSDSGGRLTGMPALGRLYPSPSLAKRVDPLRLALAASDGPPPAEAMLSAAEAEFAADVAAMTAHRHDAGREDERWYWALPALLDARDWPGVAAWIADPQGWAHAMEADEPGTGFRAHVAQLADAAGGRLDPPLGAAPPDLGRAMAELALGGPGVCSLRALQRVAPGLAADDPGLLAAASHAAAGFRTLFNLPETIALLRGSDAETPYWRAALRHAIDGNLQSLLDEQVHVLQESLGLIDTSAERRVRVTAEAVASALAIRTASVRVDDYRVTPGGTGFDRQDYNVRTRFALRFGELRGDREESVARADDVRAAFNSPFRPFVLASTSIGQEELDFHTWCHAVMHWNLPSNPVDLEQREGRVHRYKGHAVRKNIARAYGLAALGERGLDGEDPWQAMFSFAAADRDEGASELVPYWVFEVEGGARVERRVPMVPFTREVEQLSRLKRGLALYRLVFGQPRQEDLLEYLRRALPEARAEDLVREWRIDLAPRTMPRRRSAEGPGE